MNDLIIIWGIIIFVAFGTWLRKWPIVSGRYPSIRAFGTDIRAYLDLDGGRASSSTYLANQALRPMVARDGFPNSSDGRMDHRRGRRLRGGKPERPLTTPWQTCAAHRHA